MERVVVWQSLNSWLSEAQQQKLTFGKGLAWMPEVERPKALCKDAYKWSNKVGAGRTDNKRPRLQRRKANRAFISQECDGDFREIVRFWKGWFGRKGGGAFERVVGMARFDAAILPS